MVTALTDEQLHDRGTDWSSDEWEDFSDGHSKVSNLITYVCRRDAQAVGDCNLPDQMS